ncbi:uncharacterized protein EV154DRAFT_569572 [Mucor mucedo]|uniref:uncharacterized protein n=1 Tax=Mucor mucedo TaxID=29922 RepID=UPI0022203C62|nr:uncharacterized protein EV154DRAFT_569572 [Mucor mucedo]KAI7875246.1 hypothetical protein EV154DRAFT_569572 [Mucor mucedo]
MSLPLGWKITGRKRSIFELETNIHTLGELYTTLVDLRNQVAPQESEEQPPLTTRRSSSFSASDTYGGLSRSSSNFSMSTPSSNEEDNIYYNLITVYPEFIFELLLQLYSTDFCDKKNLVELFHLGKLNKSYASAIFAYSALHASLCHPEKYGIYSFLNNLAYDSYYSAHELIEFDDISLTTIETLVIMYRYLYLMGREAEARNLFCLAWRHMQVISDGDHSSTINRLVLSMAELDWTFSISKSCDPIIRYEQVKKISAICRSDKLEDTALKFRIRGLNMILQREQLNGWRTKYLQMFLYKRNPRDIYSREDKLALHLHALYFSGMLEYHQYQMMTAFETSHVNEPWTDYFSSTTTQTKTHVEKNLYSCMNAAYGFIQVIKLFLDEDDTCQLPQMTDTLSAACTVLYFGNKVIRPHKSPQEALLFIVGAFSTSSMMQCPRVERFVKTWTPLIKSS